jgi:uncharacterized membrane protein
MAFCAACGAQMADGTATCPKCGKGAAQSVGGGAAAAPAPAAASSGALADNVASGLAYITIIPAIVFLLVEPYKSNKTVKFHAFQCLGLAVTMFAAGIIMIIPILGWIVGILTYLACGVMWLICIIKAFSGGKFKVPVIGEFAEKQANA